MTFLDRELNRKNVFPDSININQPFSAEKYDNYFQIARSIMEDCPQKSNIVIGSFIPTLLGIQWKDYI